MRSRRGGHAATKTTSATPPEVEGHQGLKRCRRPPRTKRLPSRSAPGRPNRVRPQRPTRVAGLRGAPQRTDGDGPAPGDLAALPLGARGNLELGLLLALGRPGVDRRAGRRIRPLGRLRRGRRRRLRPASLGARRAVDGGVMTAVPPFVLLPLEERHPFPHRRPPRAPSRPRRAPSRPDRRASRRPGLGVVRMAITAPTAAPIGMPRKKAAQWRRSRRSRIPARPRRPPPARVRRGWRHRRPRWPPCAASRACAARAHVVLPRAAAPTDGITHGVARRLLGLAALRRRVLPCLFGTVRNVVGGLADRLGDLPAALADLVSHVRLEQLLNHRANPRRRPRRPCRPPRLIGRERVHEVCHWRLAPARAASSTADPVASRPPARRARRDPRGMGPQDDREASLRRYRGLIGAGRATPYTRAR